MVALRLVTCRSWSWVATSPMVERPPRVIGLLAASLKPGDDGGFHTSGRREWPAVTTPKEAKARATATYNAAADLYDDPANSFWDRFGRRTIAPYTSGALATVPHVGIGAALGLTSAFFLAGAFLMF